MRTLITVLTILLLFNCTKKEKLDENYLESLNVYRAEKMNSRKSGYLQLVALSKLNDSINIFGKHAGNHLSLNIATIPDTIGVFNYKDDILNFKAAPAIIVKTIKDSLITSIDLAFDEFGSSEQLIYNQIKWQVITRANSHYLRVWNTENPEIENFKGFTDFKPSSDFIFDADFTYYDAAKTEEVKSQLGVQASTKFVGQVSFSYQNKIYTLDVGNSGFLMVADATNDEETYGGGRYIYLDLPEKNGKVTVDFNRLYNPPCAYNKFTTCLYPPRQNRLPFKVLAGETIERIK